MHISEGILSAPVLASGAAFAAAGTAIGLKKLDYDRIPQVGILSAAFFVASLVHIPIGPASVHLVLNGLMVALSLVFTGEAFLAIAKLVVIAHLPVMVAEALITAFCVKFLKQVKPDLLEVVYVR